MLLTLSTRPWSLLVGLFDKISLLHTLRRSCVPFVTRPAASRGCARSKQQRRETWHCWIHAPIFHPHSWHLCSGLHYREVGSGYSIVRTGDFRMGSRCGGMTRRASIPNRLGLTEGPHWPNRPEQPRDSYSYPCSFSSWFFRSIIWPRRRANWYVNRYGNGCMGQFMGLTRY